jgi:hypothetical protein
MGQRLDAVVGRCQGAVAGHNVANPLGSGLSRDLYSGTADNVR